MPPYRVSFVILFFFISYANAKIYFQEQFKDGDGWKERWVQSDHKDDYGLFNLSHGDYYNDKEEDLGLTTSEHMKYYAVSARFPKFSNKGKPLIIQYAVKRKFIPEVDCGGLYIKVLSSEIDQKDFHDKTNYLIMFGPDHCSITSTVHAIIRYKEFYHNCKVPVAMIEDELTHVYTLIINPNNTVEILADNKQLVGGDLEEYYNFLRPRKMNDPNATKPAEWVDEEYMNDPNDKKPADWDQPEWIPNFNVTKPDDWDDDTDGEWDPPLVNNPDFKGEWRPKRIKNPEYKGEWDHPQVPNPYYEPDPDLYVFKDIGVLGIDLWQVNSGTTYDNIIITDDREEAQKFADLTLKVARKGEEKMRDAFEEKKRNELEKQRKEQEALEKLAEERAKEDEEEELEAEEEEEEDKEEKEEEKEAKKEKEEEKKAKKKEEKEDKEKEKESKKEKKGTKKEKPKKEEL